MRRLTIFTGLLLLMLAYLVFFERSLLMSIYHLEQIDQNSSAYYVEQAKVQKVRAVTFSLFVIYVVGFISYCLYFYLTTKKVGYLIGLSVAAITILSILFGAMSYFNPVF